MPETVTTERTSMNLAAYLGLCFVAWIVGAAVANGISIAMGSVYAEATVPTIIGFWLGKTILKNKRRDWPVIAAFPIINFIAAILAILWIASNHSSASQAIGSKSFAEILIAFALSCGLFALQRGYKTIVASFSAIILILFAGSLIYAQRQKQDAVQAISSIQQEMSRMATTATDSSGLPIRI